MTKVRLEYKKQILPMMEMFSSRGCHPVQVIMNRPTRIHTAYPGLLERDHSPSSHDLQELQELKERAFISSRCVHQWYLMNDAIDLHRNYEISITDGLQRQTHHHHPRVVPRQASRGPARNIKPQQISFQIWQEDDNNLSLPLQIPLIVIKQDSIKL